MGTPQKKPYHEIGLLDFQHSFPDEKTCWDYLKLMRWPEGMTCFRCAGKKFDFICKRKIFECKACHKQVSVTAGTLFDKSRVPLHKWFWAIFLMATSKKGVSMLYLQKQLGIRSYQTAWLMGQKIRQAMTHREALYSLKGTVEADEIYIGGRQSMAQMKEHGSNKTPFLIMVEEDKKSKPRFVSFEELETIYDEHLIAALNKKIKKGSQLKTDGCGGYINASKDGDYKHERSIYSKDKEKTQEHLKWVNILTSNLKRFLLSTYHGISHKYRKAYLAEFAYRFNRRHWPYQAFDRLIYACIYSKPAPLPVLSR
jgi:transposase-like protein